jgi:hypothetical protein
MGSLIKSNELLVLLPLKPGLDNLSHPNDGHLLIYIVETKNQFFKSSVAKKSRFNSFVIMISFNEKS